MQTPAARGPGPQVCLSSPWRAGIRVAWLALGCAVLSGADTVELERPQGMSSPEAVQRALELALLASGDADRTAALKAEADALLGGAGGAPGQLPGQLHQAAVRWARRAEPARRLLAAWDQLRDPVARLPWLREDSARGELARLSLVVSCTDAVVGSTHLPLNQAAELLSRCAGASDAVAGLQRTGGALELLDPRTEAAHRQLSHWRELLAVARVPAPLQMENLPVAYGLPLDDPVPPLLLVDGADAAWLSRPLVSWDQGLLVWDPGPPAESLSGWDSAAWTRWRTIATRRSELAMAGIMSFHNERTHGESAGTAALIASAPEQDLRALMPWFSGLAGAGEAQACLALRSPSRGGLRRSCLPLRVMGQGEEISWRLGRGGLSAAGLPGARSPRAWVAVEPGARVEDLVLALEEARDGDRSLGLLVSGAGGPGQRGDAQSSGSSPSM